MMARRLLFNGGMTPLSLSRLFRFGLVFLALAFVAVESTPASAQNRRGGRGGETGRKFPAGAHLLQTDSVLEEARTVVDGTADPEARKLLRTAMDHQKNARRLFEAGRLGPAVDETLLARRLATRAMEQGGSRQPDRREDLEQLLRRSEARITAAGDWLEGRSDPGGGLAGDLATARRAMARAREAFQAGQREDTLKHLATVRQILSAFPMSQGLDSRQPGHLEREIEATDRLIDAMERVLPPDAAGRLQGAREAQRRARERLSGDQPAAALRLAAEARAHAVRIWDESGHPADRVVTEVLIRGNAASIGDLEAVVERRSSVEAGRILAQARESHRIAGESLSRNHVNAAWDSARATLRLLWNARQSLAGDAPSRRKR